MVPPDSRYANLGEATFTAPDGQTAVYLRRRLLPDPSLSRGAIAVVRPGERVDLIAARALGSPRQFHRICDANAIADPFEVAEEPRTSVFLPRGPALPGEGGMSFGGVQLTMLIGGILPMPAPAALMLALRSAEVTVSETGSSGFQLEFQLDRKPGAVDYELLPHLDPWNRVILSVTLAGSQQVISDGLITNRQLTPGRGGRPDTINVTGEDVSVAMDLTEKPTPYPGMNDWAIANLILLEYAQYGILPTVLPTVFSTADIPLDVTNQQTWTDRAYVRKLAARNGYIFHVRPGPVPFTNVGYFGPPIRLGVPYPALSINQLPVSAVESIQFTYDALAPEVVVGMVQDTLETDMDIPVVALGLLRVPPLATRPGLVANFPYFRTSLLDAPGMDPIQAYAKAQGQVDSASDKVLVVKGEIDVFRYQHLLAMPGLVGVRGAGLDHDGLYAVTSVTHKITPSSYRQGFTLAREGLGSLLPEVSP